MRYSIGPKRLIVSLAACLPAIALVTSACSGGSERAVHEPFVALERDFQGFEAWARVDLAHRPERGNTHLAGQTHEYVNSPPAQGLQAFPVGTIFVKTVENQQKSDIFAMVKRGGGFNATGATGWEWFGLRKRGDGSVAIVWRGVNAPDGESYGGDPVGGCNACHDAAAKNDRVHAYALANR